jgi:Beta-galactosidase
MTFASFMKGGSSVPPLSWPRRIAAARRNGAACGKAVRCLRAQTRWLWLGLLLSPLLALAAEKPLFNFNPGFDLNRVGRSDAKVALLKSADGSALRINTGHKQPWPGITLPATGGHWDLSAYAAVVLNVKNAGTNAVTVYCRVDNPGADGTKNCLTESLALDPGQADSLRVTLWREAGSTLGGKLFGMRGYPAVAGESGALDVKNITQLLVFVNQPTEDHCFEVANIRAAGEHTPPVSWVTNANPFFPFIDTFGQYMHNDWPGKIHSLTELRQRRATEVAELAADPGPPGWDKYGGAANGPQLKAAGFFRTEKVDGTWWLVDPEGHLFWSHGIDCVRMLDATPIEERAAWFEEFPGDQADYREFRATGYALKGHYAGRTMKSFSFAAANLKRKYGDDWKQTYAETVHQRLRSWGLNTIANWSDSGIYLMRRTPYTDNLGSHGAKMIEGSEGYWGQFPDVFDPGFAAAVRRGMETKTNSSANDPWCIGYFSDNEMSWGDETSLALGALKSTRAQAAKREFVSDLKTKYGDIANLNATWGTSHTSWDALLDSHEFPDKSKARNDLIAFYVKTAETYFRTVRDAIKAVAPHQLYLGCRFASVNDQAAKAAGKYCDVVSYNLYHRSIAGFKYPGGDRPLIVGEFHFGALDRGLFHTGLVAVENQQARAQAYQDYVLGALHHPQVVGTHWFQWQDEPTTGRVYDEENYQIGFLDVADTPYRETIAASRDVGRRVYHER